MQLFNYILFKCKIKSYIEIGRDLNFKMCSINCAKKEYPITFNIDQSKENFSFYGSTEY